MNKAIKAVILDLLVGMVLVITISAIGAVTEFKISFLAAMILFFVGGVVRGKSELGNLWIDCLLLNVFFLTVSVIFGLANPAVFVFPVVALPFSYMGLVIRARWQVHSNVWRAATVGVTALAALFAGVIGMRSFPVHGTDNGDINAAAPQFNLSSPDGATLIASDHPGKIIVLDFWASWCGPCKSEFPYLQQIYEKYKDNPNIEFVAINSGSGDTIEKAQTFMSSQSYSIPLAFDDGKMSDLFRVEALPTLIIIDKKGLIRMRHRGFNPNENLVESISSQLDALLGEK